jgi:thymidylate synthase ThyX
MPAAGGQFSARVLTDSVSPAGVRLITLEVRFPRFILSEFNTHRVFSRNSASSRAVPTKKMIERVLENPAMPVEWGVNKPGMSASDTIALDQEEEAKAEWLRRFNIHKQVVNRVLEPFMWHTVIVTATEWSNFFELRLAENAQPEIRVAAQHMRRAMDESQPAPVAMSGWHLPLIQDDERALPIETQKMVSAARCARVSYLTHDGKRDIEKDIELFDRLRSDRHMSPFEHVATPVAGEAFDANFRGWRQFRKELEKVL